MTKPELTTAKVELVPVDGGATVRVVNNGETVYETPEMGIPAAFCMRERFVMMLEGGFHHHFCADTDALDFFVMGAAAIDGCSMAETWIDHNKWR